jgi:hypothetical protein
LSLPSTAQDNYRPKKKDLSWGVEAKGLRMSVWTNPATDKVFSAVRNSSTKKICYCQADDNNFTVYTRKNAALEWQQLSLKTQPQEVVMVAICIAGTLAPNEEMPSYMLRNAVRKKNNYSFSLDLHEYSFPADWSGTVEVKIAQSNVFCSGAHKVGEVESRAFEIKLPFTEGTTPQAEGRPFLDFKLAAVCRKRRF